MEDHLGTRLQQLQHSAERVRKEIMDGTLRVNGKPLVPNSLADNPFAGTGHYAVARLQELHPELSIGALGFTLRRGENDGSNHVVGEVEVIPGQFCLVDATLEQFAGVSEIPYLMVFGPTSVYPYQVRGPFVRETQPSP